MDFTLRKESFLGTETKINFIVTIELSNSNDTLYFADKPLYIDGVYYESRLKIPEIKNQLSDLLEPSIEASEVTLTLDNSDGFYNDYLVGGTKYTSFVGSIVKVYYGVGDVLSTGYIRVFWGQVHQEGAVTRNVKTLTVRARDVLSIYVGTKLTPEIILTDVGIPAVDIKLTEKKTWPYMIGDWSVDRNADTTFPDSSNGNTNNVRQVSVVEGFEGVYLGTYNFDGQGAVGENGVSFSGTLHVVAVCNAVASTHHMHLVTDGEGTAKLRPHNFVVQDDRLISIGNDMYDFWTGPDTTGVLKYYVFDTSWQSALAEVQYEWKSGDKFLFLTYPADDADVCTYDDPVSAAKILMKTFANLDDAAFDGFSWSEYTTAAQRFRWGYFESEAKPLIEIALSFLKQHRLDMFLTKDVTFKLTSLKTEVLPTVAVIRQVENLDIDEDSVQLETLRKEHMNYAQGKYNFLPFYRQTIDSTPVRTNYQSLNRAFISVGKLIDMPNHSDLTIVQEHIDEWLRLLGAGLEFVDMKVSYKHIDIEPGEFISVTFSPGFHVFDNAPMQVRSVSIDPQSAFIEIRCLGLANYAWTAYEPANVALLLSTSSAGIS
jgi:hypothetical protein